MAEYIGQKTDRNGQETIFGDSIITTLIALKTGRRVAANLADLDPVWFQIGVLSRKDIVDKIETDHATYFIIGNWHNATDTYFKDYLMHCYHLPRNFRSFRIVLFLPCLCFAIGIKGLVFLRFVRQKGLF